MAGIIFGKPRFVKPEMEEIQLLADCVVHFRPMKGWKGKKYGFDWMRIGDTELFGDDKYKEIMGVYDKYPSSDANEDGDPTATFSPRISIYNNFKKEYHDSVYKIPWLKEDNHPIDYFPSWVSFEKNKEITLSLRVQIKDKHALPQSLVLAYNKDYFTITSTLGTGGEDPKAEPTPNPDLYYTKIPIKKDTDYKLTDEIKITSIRDIIAAPQIIRVLQDGKEAGFLKVLPNKMKILNVVCVKVKALVSSSTPKTGIVKGRIPLTEFLLQSLIKVNIVEVELDISTNSNGTANTILKDEKIKKDRSLNINGKVTYDGVEMGLPNYLDLILKKDFKNPDNTGLYDNFLKIYYFNEDAIIETTNGVTLSVGGRGPKGSGHAMIFNKISDVDVAHEAMHALGLPHPFGIENELRSNPYLFKYRATENIMDYAHLAGKEKYTTWKWQWDILRRHPFVTNQT